MAEPEIVLRHRNERRALHARKRVVVGVVAALDELAQERLLEQRGEQLLLVVVEARLEHLRARVLLDGAERRRDTAAARRRLGRVAPEAVGVVEREIAVLGRPEREVLVVPAVAPLVGGDGGVAPVGVVHLQALQGVGQGVDGRGLLLVLAVLVGLLVVHVERHARLGHEHRDVAQVAAALGGDLLELLADAVADGALAKHDAQDRVEVAAAHDAEGVDVELVVPRLEHERHAVVVVRAVDGLVVDNVARVVDEQRRDLEHRRLHENKRRRRHQPHHGLEGLVVLHKEVVGEELAVDAAGERLVDGVERQARVHLVEVLRRQELALRGQKGAAHVLRQQVELRPVDVGVPPPDLDAGKDALAHGPARACPAVFGVDFGGLVGQEPGTEPARVHHARLALLRAGERDLVHVHLHREPHAEAEALVHGGGGVDAQLLAQREVVEVVVANEAAVGLVHGLEAHERAVAEHVRQRRAHRGPEMAQRGKVAVLEVGLDVGAVDLEVREVDLAGEEQREHGERREPLVVQRPEHLGVDVGVVGRGVEPRVVVQERGLGGRKPRGLQAGGVERPERCAAAAREPAPHVLVRVEKHVEPAHAVRDAQDLDGVRDEVVVVDAGPRVLERLPHHDVADGVVAPQLDALEVQRGLLERERPAHEQHVLAVKPHVVQRQRVAFVRRHERAGGKFHGGVEVDAAQDAAAAERVDEVAGGVHGERLARQDQRAGGGVGGFGVFGGVGPFGAVDGVVAVAAPEQARGRRGAADFVEREPVGDGVTCRVEDGHHGRRALGSWRCWRWRMLTCRMRGRI